MTPGQFATYNNTRFLIYDVLPYGTIRAIGRDRAQADNE